MRHRRIFRAQVSVAVPLALAMFVASSGWSRYGGQLTADESAWWVGGIGALLVVALVIDTLRRVAFVGTAALAALTSVLASIVIIGRNQGVFAPSITAMLAMNAVCVVVSCLAIVRVVRRTRTAEPEV